MIYFNRSSPIKFESLFRVVFLCKRCYWQVLVVGLSSGYHLLSAPCSTDPATLPRWWHNCRFIMIVALPPRILCDCLKGRREGPRDYQKFVPGVLLLISFRRDAGDNASKRYNSWTCTITENQILAWRLLFGVLPEMYKSINCGSPVTCPFSWLRIYFFWLI